MNLSDKKKLVTDYINNLDQQEFEDFLEDAPIEFADILDDAEQAGPEICRGSS